MQLLVRSLLFTALLASSASLSAQLSATTELPPAVRTADFTLSVSDVQTTTLVFPYDVVSVDRGTPDVLTQTLEEVVNVVKVKAADDQLDLTSLTVITSGGMVYTFRVRYDRYPTTLTYNLAELPQAPARPVTPARSLTPAGPAAPAPPLDAAPASTVPMAPSSVAPPVGSSLSAPASPALDSSITQVTSSPQFASAGWALPGSLLGLWYAVSLLDASTTPVFNPVSGDGGVGGAETSSALPVSAVSAAGLAPNPMGLQYRTAGVAVSQLEYVSQKLAAVGTLPGAALRRDRAVGSQLDLEGIWIGGDILYFRFTLRNLSQISYDVDFWRFYVVDAKQAKRTAVQERDVELLNVYAAAPAGAGQGATRRGRVEARGAVTYVVAMKKFTIPDRKNLVLELFERGGGRHHELKLKNRHLVTARLIPATTY